MNRSIRFNILAGYAGVLVLLLATFAVAFTGFSMVRSNFTNTVNNVDALAHNVVLRVRGDFINAFNCVNFQAPSTNISSTAFGTISAAYPSRNIQLGMKLTF